MDNLVPPDLHETLRGSPVFCVPKGYVWKRFCLDSGVKNGGLFISKVVLSHIPFGQQKTGPPKNSFREVGGHTIDMKIMTDGQGKHCLGVETHLNDQPCLSKMVS